MRILITLLLLVGGIALYFYSDSIWALASPAFGIFLTRVGFRILWKAGWLILVIFAMPPQWRRRYDDLIEAFNEAVRGFADWIEQMWRISPWPIRIVMTILGAAVCGVFALVLLVFPVHIRRLPFGPLVQERLMPYLMRTAAAKSVERQIPGYWHKAPRLLRHGYIKLWYWTAYRGVDSRQLGRSAIRWSKKKMGY